MRTTTRIFNAILFIISLIAFFWLLFIFFQVNTNLPEALNIDKSPMEPMDYLIGLGHIFNLVFILYSIVVILSHFHSYNQLRMLKTILLIMGIVSLFAIGAEKVMADEIARQYRLGMSISEVSILNASYIINIAFSGSVLYFILKTFPILRSEMPRTGTVDEKIFIIVQCMGILSGVIGLLMVFDLSGKENVKDSLTFYIPFFILFVTPYGLAVTYWLSFKLKQKISDWYDEKQLQDIMKAALTTLILSVPGLFIFLFLDIQSILFFFLYYLFLILVIFSVSTLAYNRL